MDLASTLPTLLGLAWLLPLVSFALILFFGPRMGKHGRLAAHVAIGAILTGFVLSLIALVGWVSNAPASAAHEAEHTAAAKESPGEHPATAEKPGAAHAAAEHGEAPPVPTYYAGDWYTLASFGPLRLTIGYHIDALTVIMFAMVTLIATCIHFYAVGYMHEELHEVTDHEVTLADGHHLHRPGRFPRFFQYLSLFCFSMLGLVIAGNIFMVFVFWELVGICSYFLIGFYVERKSASTAANKAFIVNRVGDFWMIIGLMALWGSLGTFAFGDRKDADGKNEQGIFSQVRAAENGYELKPTTNMVRAAAPDETANATKMAGLGLALKGNDVRFHRFPLAQSEKSAPAKASPPPVADSLDSRVEASLGKLRDGPNHLGYGLLVVAGLGIFCGCVGKSAQFPLHVWLPDAMEGPTPVSALVHSATMVAAGVYLVGRFYPVFTPEVLLVIAACGGITLFLGATIAITAVDIKRVLAYSTISQLGYMMLALGVGGWLAGLFHLITHAFFKSLLFLCSGSVIHACHTNDMRRMGGLRHKMPYTAYTMLVGCLAIAGGGIPFVIGLSGYYSKDSIIAQALSFMQSNPGNIWCSLLFFVATGGAAITAFYMFRLWYMTFAGQPRDHHVNEHAHESPRVMTVPLMILAAFAIGVGWEIGGLTKLLEQARPAMPMETVHGVLLSLAYPHEHAIHKPELAWIHDSATWIASGTALLGFLLATVVYCWRLLDPAEVANQFRAIYRLLWNKWYFDEIYQVLFVEPVMFLARRASDFDRRVIDRFVDGCAMAVRHVSTFDDFIDRWFVDGAVNVTAHWIHSVGLSLRGVQTGRIRQYVMFVVVGTVGLFILISFFWNAGWGN